MEPKIITITFKLKEGVLDTTLPNRDRAAEDLYEHIEKLGLLKNADTYDFIQEHRQTTYIVKVY